MRPEEPRQRHRTDWMALLSGLLFIAMGVAFMSGELNDSLVSVPLLLSGLGLAGFVAVIAKVFRKR